MIEKEFIVELKSYNSIAYGKLIDNFQQKVFVTCISFVPNKEDAEDISQEVFVEVFKSIKKFKENSQLSTWIYRITINKCLGFIRKHKAKKRFRFMQSISGNEISIDKTNYFTEFNHPGVILENKERSETFFYAINQLPDMQKIAFTLHKLDGKSHQEISDIIKKSVSSVESLIFRAKKNLRRLLGNYYKNDN